MSSVSERVAPFVSSTTDNVYAIFGLPEEVISVLFAYVSRSPLGFRENLAKLLADGDMQVNPNHSLVGTSERARKFHEKWIIGYGHSSVAEHTVIHIGVEKISRIASEELKRSNKYLSFTEYSQRYQQPKRGDWHIPETAMELLEPFYQKAYDFYEQTFEELLDMLKKMHPDKKLSNLKAQAGEDARYLLPLGMYSNLGMTANARAISESLERLWYSDLPEVRALAEGIVKASQFVAPTLIRHPEKSARKHPHSFPWKEALNSIWDESELKGSFITTLRNFGLNPEPAPSVYLAPPTLEMGFDPGALITVLNQISDPDVFKYVPPLGADHGRVRLLIQKHIGQVLSKLGKFDKLPDSFASLSVSTYWFLSEAAWHQLLRHRRATFIAGRPSARNSHVTPPLFKVALERGNDRPMMRLLELAAHSRHLYEKLFYESTPEGGKYNSDAEYAVLNAAVRPVYGQMNLQDLWDLTRLRTRDDVQEELRETTKSLVRQLARPDLLGEAALHFIANE